MFCLRRLNYDSVLFGDFIIDPIVDIKSNGDYAKLIYVVNIISEVCSRRRLPQHYPLAQII